VRWQCWDLAHFNRAFGTLAFETFAKPNLNLGPTDEALVAGALTELARRAPVLERHLENRRYLVGNGITIADRWSR
jgi:glutathione S-transferase